MSMESKMTMSVFFKGCLAVEVSTSKYKYNGYTKYFIHMKINNITNPMST